MRTVKLLLSIIALTFSLTLSAQNKIFERYSDMRNVSSVYISKAMIDNQSGLFTGDLYIGKVAGQLDGVYIISTRDPSIKKELRQDISRFISEGKYELLMKQKGTVSSSAFYIKEKSQKTKELIMITDGASTLKMISLVGDFTLKDIQNITRMHDTSYTFSFNTDDLSACVNDIQVDIPNMKEFNFDFSFDFDSLKNFKIENFKELEKLKDVKSLKDLKEFKEMKEHQDLQEK